MGEGIHTWKVRGVDQEGNKGAWSLTRTLVLDATPPSPTIPSSPADKSTIATIGQILSWNASSDAVTGIRKYILQFGTDKTFVATATVTTNGLSRYVTLTSGQTNWWRVRAYDKAGNTNAWSSAWAVYVDTNTVVPTLLSPVDAFLTNQVTLLFSWSDESAKGVIRYHVEVRSNNVLGNVRISETNITSSSASLGTLVNGNYVWRVRACKSVGGWQAWSGTRSLIVDTLSPSTPVMLRPLHKMVTNDNTPAYSWNSVSDLNGPIAYELGIDASTFVLSTTNYVSAVLTDGSHRWRIRARDAAGNWSGYSAWRTNFIDTIGPNVPVHFTPANISTNRTGSVSFSWSVPSDVGQSGVSHYLLVINTQTNLILTSSCVRSLADGSYTWRVCAVDNEGNKGSFSSPFTLTVDTAPMADSVSPTTPALGSPATSFQTTNKRPTFVWNKATDNVGVTGYEILLDGTVYSTPETNWTPPIDLAVGTHTWSVRAKDAAGNTSLASEERVFTILKVLEKNSFSVKPNPLNFKKGEMEMVITYGSKDPAKTQFEIYTINGKLVQVLKDDDSDYQCVWDGNNAKGSPVATGTYLMLMRVNGKVVSEKPVKVGVIR
jgi:hypothetical protein